jgi:transposase-like protein
MVDVGSTSSVAVGRKYGVSDKAVRKWIRWYEYQRELELSNAQKGAADQAA